MLILTRRVGETVMIGNDVTVTVLGVKGNQVRVGVNAPRDVAVHREEIFERIKREEAGRERHDVGASGRCTHEWQRPCHQRHGSANRFPDPTRLLQPGNRPFSAPKLYGAAPDVYPSRLS